jgi:transposase
LANSAIGTPARVLDRFHRRRLLQARFGRRYRQSRQLSRPLLQECHSFEQKRVARKLFSSRMLAQARLLNFSLGYPDFSVTKMSCSQRAYRASKSEEFEFRNRHHDAERIKSRCDTTHC